MRQSNRIRRRSCLRDYPRGAPGCDRLFVRRYRAPGCRQEVRHSRPHYSSSSEPPPGIRSMIFFATQISQSSAPVSFALTSSFTSLPTVSTRDQGIFTASCRLGPHIRPSLFERRPRAGCTRIQSVAPPMSTWVTRGCVFSPTCMSKPLTLPISQSSRSFSFLSRTSRTRSTSASKELQRDGYQRQDERDYDDDRNDGVAQPAVAILPEVNRIVHEKQERHDREGEGRAGEGHRDHRHLDRIHAQHQ